MGSQVLQQPQGTFLSSCKRRRKFGRKNFSCTCSFSVWKIVRPISCKISCTHFLPNFYLLRNLNVAHPTRQYQVLYLQPNVDFIPGAIFKHQEFLSLEQCTSLICPYIIKLKYKIPYQYLSGRLKTTKFAVNFLLPQHAQIYNWAKHFFQGKNFFTLSLWA